MFDIQAMTLGRLVATVVQLGIPLVGLLAIVVLRFLRRGAARFALTPAMGAIVLLPIAAACGITSLALREALRGFALSGSGGVAAISAGLAECMLALMIGFASTLVLGPVAWMAVAAGSSRLREEASGTGISTPASLLTSGGLTGGLFVFLWRLVTEISSFNASPSLSSRLNFALAGSVAVCALLAMIVLGSAWAPRGRSSIIVSLLSLGMLALLIVGGTAGLWVVHRRMDCFRQAAVTGTACDDLDTLPALATGAPAISAEATPLLAAPPPPPPSPSRASSRSETKTSTSTSDKTAVRVGGAIREPKKVKDVRPVYPAIAQQARVQGVVILECRIGPQGDVVDVKVLRAVPLLDAAAVDAVRQWRYAPTVLNGVPVSVIMTVTVNFHLS
jgi:TonB family protein